MIDTLVLSNKLSQTEALLKSRGYDDDFAQLTGKIVCNYKLNVIEKIEVQIGGFTAVMVRDPYMLTQDGAIGGVLIDESDFQNMPPLAEDDINAMKTDSALDSVLYDYVEGLLRYYTPKYTQGLAQSRALDIYKGFKTLRYYGEPYGLFEDLCSYVDDEHPLLLLAEDLRSGNKAVISRLLMTERPTSQVVDDFFK